MKKRLAIALCLVLMLTLLVGCSKHPFVGTWLEDGTGNQVEFKNNGTVIFTTPDGSGVSCNYEAEEDSDEFNLIVPVPGGEEMVFTMKYTVEDDILTLTTEDGISTKYTEI